MRMLMYLGALLSLCALVVAAPAGLALNARDDGKTYCGVTTVYVTAPSSSGESFSMTFTRTVYDTRLSTVTIGKSTTTDVISVKVPTAKKSEGESPVIVTNSAVEPVSSEAEKTTTLKITATQTRTHTISVTTTHTNGDVEVVPITVEEPVQVVTPVAVPVPSVTQVEPSVMTIFTTQVNTRTTTVKTTTTLPNGIVVVTSFVSANDAVATFSMGKNLHDSPPIQSRDLSTLSSSEQAGAATSSSVETFDPTEPVVVVEVTRFVEPLSTPPPVETTSSTSESVESSDILFPVFTPGPDASSTYYAVSNVIDEPKLEPTTTVTGTLSITISSTLYTDSANATGTSDASSASSSIHAPSGNSTHQTGKPAYPSQPMGWNHTVTYTKAYESGPSYGYDHLSKTGDHSAGAPVYTAPAQASESSIYSGSPVGPVYRAVPHPGALYPGAKPVHGASSAEPVMSALPIKPDFKSLEVSMKTIPAFTYVWPGYGNAKPSSVVDSVSSHDGQESSTHDNMVEHSTIKPSSAIVSLSSFESVITSTSHSAVKPSTKVVSESDTDAVATSTGASAGKPSHSTLFSHIVSDLPYSASTHSASQSSSGASNATMTSGTSETESSMTTSVDSAVVPSSTSSEVPVVTEEPSSLTAPSFSIPTFGLPSLTSSDGPVESEELSSLSRPFEIPTGLAPFPTPSTRLTVSVQPSTITAPSFAIPTATTVEPFPISRIRSDMTDGLPPSIISSWLSLQTSTISSSRLVISVQPSSLTAPSFLIPTVTGTAVTRVPPASTSDEGSLETACGEQGPFSLNFDDLPPIAGPIDNPIPVFSPYKHFFFSEGFAYGPPPRIPFVPESAPLLLQFQTQSDVNVTRNDNNPLPGEWGATGEIGVGENLRWGCYSFNALGASVGCDSLGPNCDWQFTAVTYNEETNDWDEPWSQRVSTPGCPAGEGCGLTEFIFLQGFVGIQSLRINVTVEGVPKIWWMDDLQLNWFDATCEGGLCRESHR